MTMTRSHNTLTVDVPEIGDTVMHVEPNDCGGMPVILLLCAHDDELSVFNWVTGRYEPPMKVIIQWPT